MDGYNAIICGLL